MTMRLPTEDELQVYTADVLRAFALPGVIFYHTPNGEHRHIAVAKRLKAMGLLPGVPDWTFIWPVRNMAFLELKDHKGRQSKEQKDFQRNVEAAGYAYFLARTVDEIDGVLSGLGIIGKRIPSVIGVGRAGQSLNAADAPPKISKVAA